MSYSQSSELNSQTVSPSCAYSTLSRYNSNAARGTNTTLPMSSPQFLLVPTYGGASYQNLQHGGMAPSNACGEYFNMSSAYGSCPGSLTSLAGRNCK